MDPTDILGFAAAGLVPVTFCMRSMQALRAVALISNLAFIAYGLVEELPPVIALHGLLLPVNACAVLRGVWSQKRGLFEGS